MLSGLVLSLTGLTIVGCGPKKDSEKKTTGETEKSFINQTLGSYRS